MRKIIMGIAVAFFSVSVSLAGEAVTTLTFEGGRVHAAVPLPEDVFKAVAIEGTDLRWLAVSDGAGEEYGLKDGLYVFDDHGVFFLHHEIARCDAFMLSPGSKVVALAEDFPAARWWRFYAWVDMEPLGDIACPPTSEDLFWAGDAGVVCTILESGDYGRTQGNEPRAPRSVAYFDLAGKAEKTLLRGTSRYDYRVVWLGERNVLAEKTTVAGAEPVPGLDAEAVETVPAMLPPDDCPEMAVHYALAAEGRFSGMNEGDDIQAIIEMLPSTLGEPVFLSLSVQDSDNFAVLLAISPESRVRVVYDMVQQWNARAGERVVLPVIRKVEPMADNDPKG
jgi:hypothetical protein